MTSLASTADSTGARSLARNGAAAIATWWTILRICLEERLVYRGDFALGTLMRFLPIVTQIFLWGAIFQNAAVSGAIARSAGYTYEDMIAYYLLTHDQPGVLQHAGPGRRHRPADPLGRSEEVSDPAGRHDRVFAAQPGGAQAGLLRRGGRPFCAGLLSLPRLFSRLARADW